MNLNFDKAITLAAGETQPVGQVLTTWDATKLRVEIQNSGSNALTAFKVQCQDHPNGEFYDVLTTDYTTLTEFLLAAFGDPHTLAAGSPAHLVLDASGVYAVRFIAASTSGTIVSVRGGASVPVPH